jgi:hypothetical protein
MSDSKKLKKDLKDLFKKELGGFFRQLGQEEKEFLATKAVQIAEQRIALELAKTPAEKRKHKRLLRALGLSVENEIIKLKIKISAKNREMLVKGIKLAIGALIAAI